jgi:hypothetical protein
MWADAKNAMEALHVNLSNGRNPVYEKKDGNEADFVGLSAIDVSKSKLS